MANDDKLSDDEVNEKLDNLQIWSRSGEKLVTRIEFNNYKEAAFFANTVFSLAEAHFHHPEIRVEYGAVEIDLWSHDAEAITQRDFELAEDIEQKVGEIKWS
ncbi:MAG: 4a-hydroxytetrahydrobiopterin dehydratase [Candidatus Nanohalobium sp.]